MAPPFSYILKNFRYGEAAREKGRKKNDEDDAAELIEAGQRIIDMLTSG